MCSASILYFINTIILEIKYINLFPTIIGGGILPKEITLYNKEWINYILTNPLNKFNTWNDSLTKNERLLDENIFLPLKEYIIHKCLRYVNSETMFFLINMFFRTENI